MSAAVTASRLSPRGERYTRVAIILHWLIAFFIIYNLVSGFLVWDIAKEWFRAHRPFYIFGLTSHMSSGLTVLALTVFRIVWRLAHEPPAHSHTLKPWEKHASHFAHFLLYAAMILMPLTGWGILSAHPPKGSEGQKVAQTLMPAPPPNAAMPVGPPGSPPRSGPPPGGPPAPPRIWWVLMPMPAMPPIERIGETAGGVEPQKVLHDDFVGWHEIGGLLTLALLLLHIAGALKHQLIDRQPSLSRMGIGKDP